MVVAVVVEESLCQRTKDQKDTSSTTWTRSQTLLLLELYKANVDKFNNLLLKKLCGKNCANLLTVKVFNSKQVEGRWKTIEAAYRRAKDSNRATGLKSHNVILKQTVMEFDT
ncbi:uncharacterized protein LOC127875270 [Dreissena polymorpha]|uniref:uncharacterized protein LOC127875270 n=1 Tax=Dreissena polymorpha TaxID=45954 RepID=UPI002265605E|nr:uncharacterized protein LOC127875270 [Dreissena polymorpha]